MKRHILSCSSSLFTLALFAQIPNGGFETWTASGGGYDDPNGWITWNAVTYPIGGSLSCEEGTPGAVGASFAKVTTQNVTGVGTLPGLIFTGDMTAPGFPYDQRPDAMNGQYQYDIPAGDGGTITVSLTRWNAGSQESIGGGVLSITPGTLTSWTDFSIPIAYFSSAYPDTAVVTVMSSTGGGVPGSTVWVDDLSFGALSSVGEVNTASFVLTPTLTSGPLNISAGQELAEVSLLDMSGRLVSTQKLTGRTFQTDVQALPAGVYMVRVRLASGMVGTQVFVKS